MIPWTCKISAAMLAVLNEKTKTNILHFFCNKLDFTRVYIHTYIYIIYTYICIYVQLSTKQYCGRAGPHLDVAGIRCCGSLLWPGFFKPLLAVERLRHCQPRHWPLEPLDAKAPMFQKTVGEKMQKEPIEPFVSSWVWVSWLCFYLQHFGRYGPRCMLYR